VGTAFQTLKILTLFFYAATFTNYLIFYLKGTRQSEKLTTPLLIFTCSAHLLYLFVISLSHGHMPITSLGEAMTLMVFAICCIYYFIELSTREKNLGAFVFAMALLFQILSSLFIDRIRPVNPMLKEGGFAFHAIANTIGYSGFFLGFVFSVLYLLLIRQIKTKKTGQLYRRLPSLGILDTMSLHSITLGFILFTLGLAAGSLWAKKMWGVYFKWEPKLILAFVSWGIYAGYLIARRVPGWSRKKSAWLSVAAFALLLMTFLFSHTLSPSHAF
jgi:cytochrome c-type biogenesis protein CcsB